MTGVQTCALPIWTLIHDGSGTLTLSGANRYTGGNLLTGGTVIAMTTNALGAGGKTTYGGLTITNATLYVKQTNTGLMLGNGIALQGNSTVTLSYGSSITNKGGISITYASPSSTNIISLGSTWSAQFDSNNVSGTYSLISGKSGGILGANSNSIALNFTAGSNFSIPFGMTTTNLDPSYEQVYTFTKSSRSLLMTVSDVWRPIQTIPKYAWYNITTLAQRQTITNNGVQEISTSPFFFGDANYAHTLSAILTGKGQVVVLGDNNNAQAPSYLPTNGVTRVSAGYPHIMALYNGRVYTWPSSSRLPTNTPPLASNGVVEISAGYYSCLALRQNGTLSAWGYKYNPPASFFSPSYSPVDLYDAIATVEGLANVVGIADGVNSGLALLKDGTVRGFGQPFDTVKYRYPSSADDEVRALNLTNVAAISMGNTFAMALKKDGTVVAWGVAASSAAQVPSGLSGVISISAGSDFALALKSDGSMVSWGNTNVAAAQIPAGLLPVAAIEAGVSYYSLVARTNMGITPLDDCHTAGGLKGSGGGGVPQRILPVPWSTPVPRSEPPDRTTSSSSSTQPVRAPQRVLPAGR